MITMFLDLFLLWYIFWPLAAIFFFIAYGFLKYDRVGYANFFSIIILSLVYLHWHSTIVWSWKIVLLYTAIYIAAGFLISLYKYVMKLYDFKKNFIRLFAENASQNGDNDYLIDYTIPKFLNLPTHSIEHNKKDDSYYIRYSACPIATWWAYWPFFILSIVLDPVNRLITSFVRWIRSFYLKLSQAFKVKVT